MAMVVMMAALRLLERRQGLLRADQVVALQGLPDLVEDLGQRAVCARSLPIALEAGQGRIGLLRAGEIAGIEGADELAEVLLEY